jgi:hypothetical protein
MVDQRLIDYVISAVNQGKSHEEIKAILLERGWLEKDIDEAIYIVTKKAGTQEKISEKSKTGHKKIYLAGALIAILILCVTGYYIFWLFSLPGPQTECGNGICEKGETYETCPSDCEQGPPTQENQTSESRISISPLVKNVANGEIFTLDVRVSDVQELYGFQFDVEYDSNILEFQTATGSDFLSRNGNDNIFCVDYNAQTLGIVKNIACTRTGQVGGVSGSGTIQTLTFKALKTGTCEIKLREVKLVRVNLEEISVTITNGKVTIS